MTQKLFNMILEALLDANIKYNEDTFLIISEFVNAYPHHMEYYNSQLPTEEDFKNINISNLQMQLLESKIIKAIKDKHFQ